MVNKTKSVKKNEKRMPDVNPVFEEDIIHLPPQKSWVKYFWDKLVNYKDFDKNLVNDNPDRSMNKTIYGKKGEKVKDFVKRQNRIHRWFKYIFMYPLLSLGNRLMGKSLVKDVDGTQPQLVNVKVFSDSFDRTLKDWYNYFHATIPHVSQDHSPMFLRHFWSSHSLNFCRLLKRIYLTIVVNDSAYLELHNIMMYNLARDITKYHHEQGNLSEDGKIKHLLYTERFVTSPEYFMCLDRMGLNLNLKKLKESNDEMLNSVRDKSEEDLITAQEQYIQDIKAKVKDIKNPHDKQLQSLYVEDLERKLDGIKLKYNGMVQGRALKKINEEHNGLL